MTLLLGLTHNAPTGSPPAAPTAINKSLGDAGGGSVVLITVADSTKVTYAKVCGVLLTSFSAPDGTHVQGTTAAMTASATPGSVVVGNTHGDSSPLASVYEAFLPENIANVWWDLSPTSGFTDLSTVSTWVDRVNGNSFISGATQDSTLGTVLGMPAIVSASTDYMSCTTLGSPAAAECYTIGVNSDATNYQAPDAFGQGSTGFLAFVNGAIYDSFGSSTRYDTSGSPTDYRAELASLWCYSRRVESGGNWNAYLNGVNVLTETGNTVAWQNPCQVGNITSAGGTTACFRKVAWTRVLNSGERTRVAAWVLDKFGATI